MRFFLLLLILLFLFTVPVQAGRRILLYQTWREAQVAFVTRFPNTLPRLGEVERPRVKFRGESMWWEEGYQFVVGFCDVEKTPPISVAAIQTRKELKVTLTHEFLHYLAYRLLSGNQFEEASQWIEENF